MMADDPYELKYDLSNHNAGRSCEVCQEPADTYYFIDDELSTFRCSEHPHDESTLSADA